jgi:hypothetical protein
MPQAAAIHPYYKYHCVRNIGGQREWRMDTYTSQACVKGGMNGGDK